MRRAALLALALAGCGPGPDYATAVFAVGEVPEAVSTISVFVRERGHAEIVASATVAAPKVGLALGVPAEVPLEITAVARSDRPAPLSLGGTMPIYVGRAGRTVPLGNDPTTVGLDVRPGGGLTAMIAGPDEGGRQTLVLETDGAARPVSVGVATRGGSIAQVLAEGRWRLRARDERWSVIGGEGLWIAPGVETRAALTLAPRAAARPPEAPHALALALFDAAGPVRGFVTTSSAGPRLLSISVDALDAAGAPVSAPPAEVRVWAEASEGVGLLPGTRDVDGLPATSGGWSISGQGRLHVFARAVIGDVAFVGSAHVSVGGPGADPAALVMLLESPDDLQTGTRLLPVLVDESGRLAAVDGWTVDAAGSDPWVYFPDGPSRVVVGPVARVSVARPSAPPGLSLQIRAVATSTAFSGTSSATLALPMVSPAGLGRGGGG